MKNVFYLARLGNQLLKVVRFNFSWKNLRLILFCLGYVTDRGMFKYFALNYGTIVVNIQRISFCGYTEKMFNRYQV